jgi:L,D-peptidoglycan transpeptidase YkuD (ErfK/YbiS/YcfS/YnhG family)
VGGVSCTTSTCPLKLQSKSLVSTVTTTSISPSIHISTTASGGVDLANVKLHYYYTADGNSSPAFACDTLHYVNSAMGLSGCATGTFVPMGSSATPLADTFLEISFPSAKLPAGTTVEVNVRLFSPPNYPTYNQSNDWSFISSSSANYVDATYITAYLNGTLAWGVEPGQTSDAGPSQVGDGGDGG